jgi:uncharacterized protein YndB with AHSA1/START domain
MMTCIERAVSAEIVVGAELGEVWHAWTTEEGIKTFLAPACVVDLRPGGPYEVYFSPEAPPGERGGEGNRVMSVQPMKMLSFSWNAPPALSMVREQRTHVVVRFFAEERGTRVALHHDGWGSGGEWDRAYEYFERAWKQIVLPRLKYRFENGPVDWNSPPSIEVLSAAQGSSSDYLADEQRDTAHP